MYSKQLVRRAGGSPSSYWVNNRFEKLSELLCPRVGRRIGRSPGDLEWISDPGQEHFPEIRPRIVRGVSGYHQLRERGPIGSVPWECCPITNRGRIGRGLPACSACTSLLRRHLGRTVTTDLHTNTPIKMGNWGRCECFPQTEFGRFGGRKRQFYRQKPVPRVVFN